MLHLTDGTVIDESIDIIRHALSTHDPDHWQPQTDQEAKDIAALIEGNDGPFKKTLDKYKYHTRHPETPQEEFRKQGEEWIQTLESRLTRSAHLVADRHTMADTALFPFIRQWSGVEDENLAAFPKVQAWLSALLESERFKAIMVKQKPVG